MSEKVRKIKILLKPIFDRYPILVVYLFGSRANGKADQSSDYDFAVLLSDKIVSANYLDYKLSLSRDLLKIFKSIDLVILNNTNLPMLLKYNIIKNGLIIYEKDKQVRINLEARIMSLWFDWEYFENLWQRIFIKNLAQGRIL